MKNIICGYNHEKLKIPNIKNIENIHKNKDVVYYLNDGDCQVDYFIGKIKYKGACFTHIFSSMNFEFIYEPIIVNLFAEKGRLLITKYNLKKYFKHLSSLYTHVHVNLIQDRNILYAKITFDEEFVYNRVILKDILTRVRYVFEFPYSGIINKALSNRKFSLNNIDNCLYNVLKKNSSTSYLGTGHYFFSSLQEDNVINYDTYEKDVMKFLEDNPKLINTGSLHKLSSHLKYLNN